MKIIKLLIFLLLAGNSIRTYAQSSDSGPNRLAETTINLLKSIDDIRNFSPFLYADYDPASHEHLISDARYFTIDNNQLNTIIQNHFPLIELNIPWNDTIITLQLFPSQILASTFRVVNSGSVNSAVNYSPGAYYRGIIKGDYQSFAAISFFENKISGIVSTPAEGNIVISNLRSSPTHIIYNDKNILLPNEFTCTASEDENLIISEPELHGEELIIANCVKVYIEADYEMFLGEGGITQTADQITNFFNVSSAIYFNEGITDVISEIYVWTTNDPYPSTSSGDALNYFTDYRTDFDGDLAHLVTYDNENLGGVAWLPGLCSSYNYAYSNIYNYYEDLPLYSWTIDVFTHEMGHNLGSPHTHSCSWPGGAIDDCYAPEGGCDTGPTPPDGGTIISYCHLTIGKNFSLGVGPLPGALILDAVNDAACVGNCELPPINDWPCGAIVLDVNESCIFVEGTNVGAIDSDVPLVACDGDSEGDIWFQLVIPAEGYVIIETDNGDIINDMGMKVYRNECDALTGYPLGCIPDGSSYAPLMPGLVISGPAGSKIFLRLWEVGNDDFGDFSICAYTDCVPSIAPSGIIASDTIVCEEENIILHPNGGSLGSLAHWAWYLDDCSGVISTEESLTVSIDETESYFLKIIGLCDTTPCVELEIETAEIPEQPEITEWYCELSIDPVAGATYIWYLNGVYIPGATSNEFFATENGDYAVQVTNAQGCSNTSEDLGVVCQGLNIENAELPELILYPNPANGHFTIEIAAYSGEIKIDLFDITGRIVETQNKFITSYNNKVEFDLHLSPGLYLLQTEISGVSLNTVLVINP